MPCPLPKRLKTAIAAAKILLLIGGSGLLMLGLFARQLGIDHDTAWGTGRILAVVFGSFAWLCAAALHAYPGLQDRFKSTSPNLPLGASTRPWQRVTHAIGRSPLRHLTQLRRAMPILTPLAVALVLIIYLFYITAGTFTNWTPYSTYFDRLAAAFQVGRLDLLEDPPAPLLALANPYDYRNREGFGYLWDASLYQGRYYLYWGFVPALAALAVKVFTPVVVEDQYLLFAFTAALLIVLTLTITFIQRRWFPAAPRWTVAPLVLLAGLSVPLLWLINRPNVYETAIASAQLGLILGLYAILRVLTQARHRARWMLLAGLSWGAAINSRLSLSPAVLFFTVIVLLLMWREVSTRRRALVNLSALIIPLALWALALGAYNHARFDSPFETGHRYQLTGGAMPSEYSAVVSAAYVVPSLYAYLVRPLQFTPAHFPFVDAPFIAETMWPWFIRLPEHYYYPEPLAGVFSAVPAVWLAFLPLLHFVRRAWDWLNERATPFNSADTAPRWLWGMLVGGVLSLLIPLLVFISTSMRYLADFTPLLIVLAGMGWWWAIVRLRNRPALRFTLNLTTLALIAFSIGLSLLVNLTNGDRRLMTLNPDLYATLQTWFK